VGRTKKLDFEIVKKRGLHILRIKNEELLDIKGVLKKSKLT